MTHGVQNFVIKWAQPQAHLLHVSASGGPPIYNNKIHWLLKILIGIRVYQTQYKIVYLSSKGKKQKNKKKQALNPKHPWVNRRQVPSPIQGRGVK